MENNITAPINNEGKKQLRIAYCLPFFSFKDNIDTSLLQQMMIASSLQARGHRITFISPQNHEDVIYTEDPQQQPSFVRRSWSKSAWFSSLSKAAWKVQKFLGIPYLNFFSNYAYFDAYLRSFPGHDIIHERNGLYRMGVAMACRRLHLPYILFFDGDDILEQGYIGSKMSVILQWRAKQIIRYNLTCADRVICVSKTARARLQNSWNVPVEKIAIMPNGVDTSLYRPDPEKALSDRVSLGFGKGAIIAFVGSFYPWQDTRTLIDAFAQLLKDEPATTLLMVGDGKQRQMAEDYTEELGIQDAVRFTGFLKQENVCRMVNLVDITVAPYVKMDPAHFIGSPMKMFEYMASGKAVVATNIGQIAEVIEDGKNGFLVEPQNSQALVNILLRLVRDPILRSRIGDQARKDAVQKYSWEDYSLKLEDLYCSVIQEQTHKNQISRQGSKCHGS